MCSKVCPLGLHNLIDLSDEPVANNPLLGETLSLHIALICWECASIPPTNYIFSLLTVPILIWPDLSLA